MAGGLGLEPRLTAPKTDVLPLDDPPTRLNYTEAPGIAGFIRPLLAPSAKATHVRGARRPLVSRPPLALRHAGPAAHWTASRKSPRGTAGRSGGQNESVSKEAGKCPGCGGANECAIAIPGADAKPCWCSLVETPSAPSSSGVEGTSCLCRACLGSPAKPESAKAAEASIFDSDGALTREFLMNRGTCCGNKCRNCPYGWAGG
jgi:hypothetical protein